MSLFDKDEALGRLNDLIKVGEVSSIDPATGTARVVFDDEDGTVSYDLPILQRNTYKTKDFHSVTVGEDVLCLFLPTGPEEGFILGSFYAGEITPPESTKDRRTTVFEDGTVIRYDMASHTATVIIGGTQIIANQTNVTVNCANAVVNATSGVTLNTPKTDVTGALNVMGLITGKGGLAVSGGSGATITGSLKTTGDVTAGAISLQGHTHTSAAEGDETSTAN